MKKVSKIVLKPGDTIDIVAPSSSCTSQELQHAIAWIKEQGYNPRVPPDLLEPIDYLANTDKKRLAVIKKALSSPSSKVVWCLRGGYGALRLVPDLLKLKKQTPKHFIGMSDITILHQFLTQKWNWKTIHGPVLSRTLSEKKRSSDYHELFGLLSEQIQYLDFAGLTPVNAAAQRVKKTIVAKIMGGNLCTFCSMLGTALSPKVNNHFLFFEDISERGYKIDRMLNQLEQAGCFKKCKGVLLGEFIQSDEADGRNLVWSTFENFFARKNIPVFKGIESDHSEKQRPLFLNTKAELFFKGSYTLRVHNS